MTYCHLQKTHDTEKVKSALNWIIEKKKRGKGVCSWWRTHSSVSWRASLLQMWCSSKYLLHLPTAEGDKRRQSIRKLHFTAIWQLLMWRLLYVKCFTLVGVSVTHPWFDQQAASYTEHSGQTKRSAHWREKTQMVICKCHMPQCFSTKNICDWDILTQKQQHSHQRDARVQVGKVILPQVWNSEEQSRSNCIKKL